METFAPRGKIKGPILPKFVLDLSIASGAKIMYALLCDHASTKDYCWPSQKKLAERVECHPGAWYEIGTYPVACVKVFRNT